MYAVHGNLDRSGVHFFTKVPAIYQRLGVTSEGWDFRGILVGPELLTATDVKMRSSPAYLDWEHSSTFPVPGRKPENHPNSSQESWYSSNHRFDYFADWKKDEIRLWWTGQEEPSRCLIPESLYSNPRKFEFTGAHIGNVPLELDAKQIFTPPPGGFPAQGVVVTPSSPAFGSFNAVLP
ncbi:MAG: hypothetical protein HYZ28_15280 [Myxococcales bacterium]|nr:hypothetical protein [Myxococcales bacterium]